MFMYVIVPPCLGVKSQQMFWLWQMKKKSAKSLITMHTGMQWASHFKLYGIRLKEASECGPAAFSYSFLSGCGEHFSSVFKPLLTEMRTIGDGHHPNISNDLWVSIQVSVTSLTVQGRLEVRILVITCLMTKWISELDQIWIFKRSFVMLSVLPCCSCCSPPLCVIGIISPLQRWLVVRGSMALGWKVGHWAGAGDAASFRTLCESFMSSAGIIPISWHILWLNYDEATQGALILKCLPSPPLRI